MKLPHTIEQREWRAYRGEQLVGGERQAAGGPPDGEWRTLEVTLLPTGEPDRLSLVLRDVTERSTAHARGVAGAVESAAAAAAAREALDSVVVHGHEFELAVREAQARLREAFATVNYERIEP